jgi:hypothetical protein
VLNHQNSFKTHPFHLVHINYSCEHRSGRYLGPEITLVEFSFVDGIRKPFHAYINHGNIPLAYAFQATKRARKTYRIPLPPDGFGSESYHPEILSNMNSVLVGADGE